ncbi:MAG: hypothetical protein HQ500_00685 [Flavobacteriales bacterium]|nr:hypothetical protein [Flavobacteriales bacterium]
MKARILIMLGLGLMMVLSGCRRGEDDPFISLRSRDAKVIGDWVMTEKQASFTFEEEAEFNDSDDFLNNGDISVDYDGDYLTISYITDDGEYKSSIVQKAKLQSILSIDKGGAFTYTEKVELISATISGWEYDDLSDTYEEIWTDTNYENESEEISYTGYWNWLDTDKSKAVISFDFLGKYYLVELRNNRMVWESVGTFSGRSESEFYLFQVATKESSVSTWEKLK